MATLDMQEIGQTGLKRSGGVVLEEFLRELQGPRWWRVVREMQQDAVIGGVLLAIELSLRQVAVEIEAADDTPQADEARLFVEECLGDMSSSWADTLSEIVTMLSYGYSYLEIVYKRRTGDNRDTGKASKYNDGRVGWRKWAIRSQDSLDQWAFDDEGGLQGMWQVQDRGAPVLIPIEKALLFRTSTHKGNPEGKSALRSAYTAWYYKRNISRIEAIGVERDLAGLPVVYMPPNYLSANATANERALFAAMKEIVTNIRRDEQEGVIMPMLYDGESKNKLFDLQLLTSGGGRQFDTDAIIARYNQQISMSVLADFIMMGHEKVGSYALSATKSSLFKTALDAWLQAIAAVINTHAIPRLLRLNGIALEFAPKLCFGRVGEIDLLDVVEFIKAAGAAGMTLFPGLETENHLRRLVGLPPLDEEEYQAREDERRANAEADRAAKARQPVADNSAQDDAPQDEEMSTQEVMDQLLAAQRILARG